MKRSIFVKSGRKKKLQVARRWTASRSATASIANSAPRDAMKDGMLVWWTSATKSCVRCAGLKK